MAQFEYLTVKFATDSGFLRGTEFDEVKFDEALNARGREGFELVSVLDIEKAQGGTKFVVAIMKRELQGGGE